MSEEKSAKGVKGILCSTSLPKGEGRQFFFRVYNDNASEFKDYDIIHSDLSIIIDDEDSRLIETMDENSTGTLDHSLTTLGLHSLDNPIKQLP